MAQPAAPDDWSTPDGDPFLEVRAILLAEPPGPGEHGYPISVGLCVEGVRW